MGTKIKEIPADSPYARNDFHVLTAPQVEKLLSTHINQGLNNTQIAERLSLVGENTLGDDTKINIKGILISQICNAMIMVLIISMVITLAIKDWISGGVLAFVVGINVVIGAYQEYNASKTMNSLKSLSTPSAHVIRDGNDITIQSKELVPGDICIIKVGDTVPADLRLLESIKMCIRDRPKIYQKIFSLFISESKVD